MNDDTSQKLERTGWGIIKGTVWFVVIFAILGTLFWALFYSDNLANLSFVIPLRDWYQNAYWQAEGLVMKPLRVYPPFNPIYPIEPVNKTPYNYRVLGTFTSVDVVNKIVYLTGYNQKNYSFKYGNGLLTDDSNISALSGNLNPQNVINIQILWSDNRSLQQILIDYSNDNSIPLNQNSNTPFSLIFSQIAN